jgi:hypothetical protein
LRVEVTWHAELAAADALAYDAFVLASPAGHPAQTRAWAEVARAGAHVATGFAIVRDAGRMMGAALVTRTCAAVLRLPWASIERGPVVADVSELAGVARAIASALARRGLAHIRMMPYWAGRDATAAEAGLRLAGMRDVHRLDGPHARTLRIDLAGKSDAELFAGKSKEQIRWRSSQAQRAGAVARRGRDDDWARLRAMYRLLMAGQGRRDRPEPWWQAVSRFVGDESRGALFACDYGGRTVSAAVVLRHGARATYAWGASVPDRLPFSKAIPALVAAICWARDVGCTTFDLGGIPTEGDDDPKRNAIARFKYDFDRQPVRLVREHAGWCW